MKFTTNANVFNLVLNIHKLNVIETIAQSSKEKTACLSIVLVNIVSICYYTSVLREGFDIFPFFHMTSQ
jgi:hypothetical protein